MGRDVAAVPLRMRSDVGRPPQRPAWLTYAPDAVLVAVAVVGAALLINHLWYMPNGDVNYYFTYAANFWRGTPATGPFRTLPTEYPPLALLPFTLALLPPVANTLLVFGFWMLLLVVAGYVAIARMSSRRNALAFVAYLVLGEAVIVLGRYDLVPALVTLAAFWCALRRHFTLAYVLLAAGVLLKLYPAFLIPLVVVEQWRTSLPAGQRGVPIWRGGPDALLSRIRTHPATPAIAWGVALCAGLVALGFGIPYLLNPQGTLSEFLVARHRPVQVESAPASLLWLGTLTGAVHASSNWLFNSCVYVSTSTVDKLLQNLSTVALGLGCLWVYLRQAQGKLSLGRAFIATLCVVIVTNKVFSAQYLIWVLPFVALLEGFDWVWAAICVLTTLDFPVGYRLYSLCMPIDGVKVIYPWQYLLLLALRNGLLLFVTLRAILRRDPAAAQATAPATPDALPATPALDAS